MAEAQQRISAEEFTYWIAYAELEPFGFPWERFCMAVPATVLANEIIASVPRGNKDPKPKWRRAEDFYPQGSVPKEPTDLTPQQREFLRKRAEKRKQRKGK